jgi:hypothetical protein
LNRSNNLWKGGVECLLGVRLRLGFTGVATYLPSYPPTLIGDSRYLELIRITRVNTADSPLSVCIRNAI